MSDFQIVAAAVVAVIATARIIRLVVWDKYPPMQWVTSQIAGRVPEKWEPIVTCGYCFGIYPAIANVAWMYFADLGDWRNPWWIVNGALALAYAAAVFVTFDGEIAED